MGATAWGSHNCWTLSGHWWPGSGWGPRMELLVWGRSQRSSLELVGHLENEESTSETAWSWVTSDVAGFLSTDGDRPRFWREGTARKTLPDSCHNRRRDAKCCQSVSAGTGRGLEKCPQGRQCWPGAARLGPAGVSGSQVVTRTVTNTRLLRVARGMYHIVPIK